MQTSGHLSNNLCAKIITSHEKYLSIKDAYATHPAFCNFPWDKYVFTALCDLPIVKEALYNELAKYLEFHEDLNTDLLSTLCTQPLTPKGKNSFSTDKPKSFICIHSTISPRNTSHDISTSPTIKNQSISTSHKNMLITSLEGNITVPINSTEKISVPTSTPSLTPLFAMNLNVRPADIQLESNQTNTTPTQNNPKPSKRRRPRSMGTCSPKNFTLTGKL